MPIHPLRARMIISGASGCSAWGGAAGGSDVGAETPGNSVTDIVITPSIPTRAAVDRRTALADAPGDKPAAIVGISSVQATANSGGGFRNVRRPGQPVRAARTVRADRGWASETAVAVTLCPINTRRFARPAWPWRPT